jgi:hypothetical protein
MSLDELQRTDEAARTSSRPSQSIPFEKSVAVVARVPGSEPRRFAEGTRAPYGIRWYGATSLYGHFRSFISRAIAAEQVDSRDWMRPATPTQLLARCLTVLGGDPHASSLAAGMGRIVTIDFVADSGDDRDTSYAVGRMVSQSYTVSENGQTVQLPRGEILMFGGDVAYPVATADEIHRRLTMPWNEAFRAVRGRGPTEKRVLLGVPGNHDWYDGLDGFGRLFRRGVDVPTRQDGAPQPRLLRKLAKQQLRSPKSNAVGMVARKLHLDEVSGTLRMLRSVTKSVSALYSGIAKKRRRRLTFHGYHAVQEASYFALPIADGLDLWGVDRQLGRMDFRQRQYFLDLRAQRPDNGLIFLSADPALAYGEVNPPGAELLKSTGVSLEEDSMLFLSGDFHHYERTTIAASTHIVAGGGGAFMHGTRITPLPEPKAALGHVQHPGDAAPAVSAAAYPDARASRRLVVGVPWKLMLGRAGYLVHIASGLLGMGANALHRSAAGWELLGTAIIVTAITSLLYFIAGFNRAHPRSVAAVAVPFGFGIGLLPTALSAVIPAVAGFNVASTTVVVLLCAFLGALLFGFFLQTVAILGLEHQQAFTVLGHQGFKHFVRLRVHPNGEVHGYVLGLDDPHRQAIPTIIDTFRWSPQPAQERNSLVQRDSTAHRSAAKLTTA